MSEAERILSAEAQAAVDNPRWSAGRAHYATETVTYFHGTANLYFPITEASSDMYGGSQVDGVICEHKHAEPGAAVECRRRLAQREARRRNSAAASKQSREGGVQTT